jgi:FHA domain-containing protein
VIQLRCWASERVFPVSADEQELVIGTAASCAIQVHDISNLASREHACLVREEHHWCIVDRSKNGLFLDGVRHGKSVLLPGMRIGLGPRVTLVAESTRTIALRAALARMRGWSTELADSLDVAFQNLRFAAAGKAIFMMCGEGDLLELARELHQLIGDEDRPIAFCSRGGRRVPRSDCGADGIPFLKRVASGREAIRLAHGGTIFLDNRRLPRDVISMLEQLRDAPSPIQTLVIVLSKYVRKTEVFTPTPFIIPPLSKRRREIERLFAEYEAISAERLRIEPLNLSVEQRKWIRDHCKDISEFQTAVLRFVALHHYGSAYGAAEPLRMTPSGLRQWLSTRDLATG